VAGALALAGCGSSSSTSTPATTPAPAVTPTATTPGPAAGAKTAGSSTVTLQANPTGQLMFVQSSLKASAGTVTIDFENQSSVPHNVTVANSSNKVLGATPNVTGGSKKLTLKLAKGTYTYYCSVPGHEAAGMKGTLTVS
jgi:plastocyanin